MKGAKKAKKRRTAKNQEKGQKVRPEGFFGSLSKGQNVLLHFRGFL